MFSTSANRGNGTAGPRVSSRPRAFLTTIFCAFAALLPVVSVVAPKGTVVLLLLAAILAVPTYWRAQRRVRVPELRIAIALALLVVWCAIASAWSADPARSLVLALRIAVVFAAGMALFPIAAALDEAAKHRIGKCLVAGFGLSVALMIVETGLDYPLLRSFKEADAGREVFWFNRGAVAMALIVWPLTAYLWGRGIGWKALVLPAVLAVASLYLESAAATLGLVAGAATVLLAFTHRKVGVVVTIAASVLVFFAMPFAAREMHSHGWHRSEWLAPSAQHRVEIWNFSVQRIAEKPLLGWGFDASRHLKALYPDPSMTGRELAVLHPHNAPLQIMLEVGAVGAVLACALLWLIATRLGAASGRTRIFGQALYIAVMAIGCVAYGQWQNWWLALIVSVAILVPLTAVPAARDDGTVQR